MLNFYESAVSQNKSIKEFFEEMAKRNDVEFYFENEKVRLFYHNDTNNLCRYTKNGRSYGYPIKDNELKNLQYRIIGKRKTPQQVWYDSWKKVLDSLKQWDINRDLLLDIENLLKLDLETVYKLKEMYWNYDDKYEEELKKYGVTKKIGRLWLFEKPAKVKKMRFVKYGFNEEYYKKIENAFVENKNCEVKGDNGYNVKFSFVSEQRSAFYSEEFKGCSNGYYYLAISPTHAVFIEKD